MNNINLANVDKGVGGINRLYTKVDLPLLLVIETFQFKFILLKLYGK